MSVLPLQFAGGLGGSALLLGGGVFVLVFAAIIGVLIWRWRNSGDPWDQFADACHAIVDAEDADAIALIPYSDGPMIPKPAMYDQELLGGTGGYRTSDGEIIYVDGQGTGRFDLEGVPLITAIDPTEHASAADPLKAWVSHKKDIGEWIKVDREGNLIEAGEAVMPADPENAQTPAMEQPRDATAADDDGHVSEVHERAHEDGLSLQDAKEALEAEGVLKKVVDIAPPREAIVDEETGEMEIEEADHVGINISSAANLLPKKTNTAELQVMKDKARNEARDQEQYKEALLTGAAVGGAIGGGIGVIMALIFAFT